MARGSSCESRDPYAVPYRYTPTVRVPALRPGRLQTHGSRLIHHRVAQQADLRHLDLDHVAGLEPLRRRLMPAGSGGGAGPDEIARRQGGEGRDVVDEPGKAPGEAIGGVVLAQCPVDPGGQMQRFAGIELV